MNRYKVILVGRKRAMFVTADYCKIETGVAIFRNSFANRGDGYPTTVQIFAAGSWVTIIKVESK